MQLVRTVHAAHQRAHVRSGAGPGDEHEIAIQTFAADAIVAEKIARRFDDVFRGEDSDVHARQQTDESGVVGIEGDADCSGARHAGERVGDADVGGREFGFAAPSENAGQAFARREKFGRKIRRRRHSDAARPGRDADDGAGQGFGLIDQARAAGRARDSFHGRGSCAGGKFKGIEGGALVHFVLCGTRLGPECEATASRCSGATNSDTNAAGDLKFLRRMRTGDCVRALAGDVTPHAIALAWW